MAEQRDDVTPAAPEQGRGPEQGPEQGDYEHALAHEPDHPARERERPLVEVRREADDGDADWSYAMAHDVPRPGGG